MSKPTRNVVLIALFFLSIVLLDVPFTSAEITSSAIYNDTRNRIEYENFGYGETGKMSISISSVYVNPPDNNITPNLSLYGFYLYPHPYNKYDLEHEVDPDFCMLDHPQVWVISRFSDLSPPPESSLKKTITLGDWDRYMLMFANCETGSSVSMNVDLELYNVDSNGRRYYLPYGEAHLPLILFVSSVFYIPLLIYWSYTCYMNRQHVYKIHICMGALLLVTAITLVFAAEDQLHRNLTGRPREWGVLFQFFDFMRALFAYILVMLISAGLSFVKSFLTKKETSLLIFGFLLQVVSDIAHIEASLSAQSTLTFEHAILIQVLGDIGCWAIIMALVSESMQWLRETAEVNKNAVENLKKMRDINGFYILALLYFVYTKYLILGLRDSFYYSFVWMTDVASEIATLGFYTIMLYMFRPIQTNQYFTLGSDEEDEQIAMHTIQTSEEFDIKIVY